jgi:hypothetical protein
MRYADTDIESVGVQFRAGCFNAALSSLKAIFYYFPGETKADSDQLSVEFTTEHVWIIGDKMTGQRSISGLETSQCVHFTYY